MKIIKTDGVYSLARVENCTGWYWCSDYACGDLYEAEELFRDGHSVRQNRLVFVKYPEGRVVEPVKASEGQYFGAPVFYDGKLRILMVDFPGAVIRLLAYDDESGRTSQFARLPLGEVSDCYNLMLKRSPLMLTRHGADDLFQELWPERAEFRVGAAEAFEGREGDRLYFCRWVEDPEYREEMVVRSFPAGEVLEVLPGTMWEMPDGQKWILQ